MVSAFHTSSAKLTGIFFILAAVFSIIGLKLYDPILQNPDFINTVKTNSISIIAGVWCELILLVSACGTGILFYPVLKTYHEGYSVAYICFRLLEVVFILFGILCILAVLSISTLYSEMAMDKNTVMFMGKIFISIHDWAYILGPNYMLAINTCIYSYVFYRTNMIPKKLSILGLLSSAFIMIAAHLELFGYIQQFSVEGILLAIPIAIYEMSLAIYLIRLPK